MILPVEVKKLYYRYPDKKENILNGINLKVGSGEILVITGLSGSGKSTLCYCINGIIPHVYGGELKGEVLLYGKRVEEMKIPYISTKVGIVFQDPDTQLFSPTVEDEIAFGPENLCLDRTEIGARIKKTLRIAGMERYRFEHPEHLSGGEKQLIALASVLSLNPQVLIFDESMSQIDQVGKNMIKKIAVDLKKAGKTIIMIEHDLNNLSIADRVLVLKEGKLKKFYGTL